MWRAADRHPLVFIAILLTASGVLAHDWRLQAQPGKDEQACRAAQAKLKADIASVFRDFEAAPDRTALDLLVSIDGRIRALLRTRPTYRPCESDRESIYDPRWERMGVLTGYWDDLTYTGALLVAAHKTKADSPLRPHTLFSTVFGETPWSGLGVMPDVRAAFAYAEEFPNGPFITDVYLTIAHFHKDLFMVLRDRRSDYKYECFQPYITSGPWPAQRDAAQRIALEYYDRVLRFIPGDDRIRSTRDLTKQGTVRGWSFCAD